MSLDNILRSIGKNLFDINTTPTFTRTGATYTVSGTTITFKSNNTTNNSFFYSIPVEIGKTYTVSVSSIDWDSTSLGMFLSATKNSDLKDYGIINKTTLSKTFTTTSDTLWIHGYLSYAAGDFTFSFDKLQVEEGTTATSYEPYQQGPKSIIIPSNSKNLIKYPYTETTKTQKGITFTDNGDGTITVNGTSTGLVTFTLGSVSLDYTKSYFLHGKNTSSNLPLRIQIGQAWRAETGNGLAISQEGGNTYTITLSALKGFTFDNVIIYPQLEEGTAATEFSLNTGDKEVLKVSYGSKNLIPYPYTNTSSTMFGVTFTVNSDSSVTVNGTATANTLFELETDTTMFTLPAGNYFLSGCPSGGSPTSYFMAAANGAGISYDKFQRDFGNGIYVPSKGEKWKISIRIISGYTANNLTFYPQLELGNKATEYVPYSREVVWTKT